MSSGVASGSCSDQDLRPKNGLVEGQLAHEAKPTAAAYLPLGHAAQAVRPGVAATVPAAQAVQVGAAAAEY